VDDRGLDADARSSVGIRKKEIPSFRNQNKEEARSTGKDRDRNRNKNQTIDKFISKYPRRKIEREISTRRPQ